MERELSEDDHRCNFLISPTFRSNSSLTSAESLNNGLGQLSSTNSNDSSSVPSNIIDASTGGFVVFVYGIGPETTQDELLTMFRDFGPILRTDVIKNKRTTIGKGKQTTFQDCEQINVNRMSFIGYGFVVFRHMNDALASIKAMHNMSYKGRFLQVRFRV